MEHFDDLLDHEEGADVLMGSARAPEPAGARCAVRGFTLIELVVTIALLGVLLTLSLPGFMTWIRNSQVRTAADALQGGLRTAQAEAIRRNRQVVMSFTNATPALNATAVAGGKNWSLQSVAQFGESTTDSTRYIGGGAIGDVASGVSIVDHAGTGISAVCFNSNGRLVTNATPGITGASCTAAATAFDISQTRSDRPLRVTVAIGGQVRMCDPKRPTLSSTSPDGCP